MQLRQLRYMVFLGFFQILMKTKKEKIRVVF